MSFEFIECKYLLNATAVNKLIFQFLVPNVTTNTEYNVRIAASSKSLYSDRLIQGKLSDPKEIRMFPDCEKIQEFMRRNPGEISAGMVAGAICAGFAFLLAISAFVLWRLLIFILYINQTCWLLRARRLFMITLV